MFCSAPCRQLYVAKIAFSVGVFSQMSEQRQWSVTLKCWFEIWINPLSVSADLICDSQDFLKLLWLVYLLRAQLCGRRFQSSPGHFNSVNQGFGPFWNYMKKIYCPVQRWLVLPPKRELWYLSLLIHGAFKKLFVFSVSTVSSGRKTKTTFTWLLNVCLYWRDA